MPQGRRLRIAATTALALILAALAGQGSASGLDVPSTSTLTTDPVSSTTTLDAGSTLTPVTNTVDSVSGTLTSTATSTPSLPSGTTTTSPTTTVKTTTQPITDTTTKLTNTVTNTVTKVSSPTTTTKTTSPTSLPLLQSSPTTSSGTTQTPSSSGRYLTGSTSPTGGGTSGGGTSGSGYVGPGSTGTFGSSSGTGTAAGAGPLYASQVTAMRSILDYLARGSRIGGAGAGAVILQLQAALSDLQGCFYGLSGRERRVLTMRAGLNGGRPRSRSFVAKRLGTTRGNVRQIEQNALFTLDGLAISTGCASGPGAAAAVADGFISPTELARAPQLVTLADPAYQGAGQSQFTRLGTVPKLAPGLPAPRFGQASRSGALWALQLLVVMLGFGLVGIVRGAPAISAWLRVKREGLPARALSARSPEPSPRPVHRHAGLPQGRTPEGARPSRREIPS
jgi:hypothetical protein